LQVTTPPLADTARYDRLRGDAAGMDDAADLANEEADHEA